LQDFDFDGRDLEIAGYLWRFAAMPIGHAVPERRLWSAKPAHNSLGY
jgi:hypothetical protein